MTEGERLAQFSVLVRESSLKRFRQVASADRNWRLTDGQLSFADLLKHLCDADRWVLAILQNAKEIPNASVKPGDGNADEWEKYLSDLELLGKEKAEILKKISEKEWSEEVKNAKTEGKTTKWLLLMRSNLDHEIHHRGSLQTMLNLKYKTDK